MPSRDAENWAILPRCNRQAYNECMVKENTNVQKHHKFHNENIMGHNSEQGLDDNDSVDENEQRMMSNIIDNYNGKSASTSNSRQVLLPAQTNTAPSYSHVYNFSHCSVTLNIAGDNSAQASTSLSASQTAKRGWIIQDSESD